MTYNYRKIRLLGLTIKEGCNPKLTKTLATGYYPFYTDELSDAFFLRNVSVTAIVGMNGAGKSSLLELIFRMINNFSACLVGNTIRRNGADEIYFIPGIKATLDYEIRDHHFFDEGIGMRQIIDYFLVVCDFYKVYQKSSNPSFSLSKGSSTFSPSPSSSGSGDVTAPSRCSEPLRSKVGGPSKVSPNCAGWDRRGVSGDTSSVSCSSASGSSASTALVVVQRELKYLGLWKFARAVMYVLHEALGLPEEKMIAPMDEKRGKSLLAEILNGGNFGKHFTKYGHFTQQGMAKKYFLKIWRNMHFVRYYLAEALSEPIFRTWHFFWRMKNKK